MPHPDTHALVERIFSNEQVRTKLYSHAARFFDRSLNQQRAGLDARDLVSAVIERVLKDGTLHQQPKPEAYLMRAITNAGIDARRRYVRHQQRAPKLVDPAQVAPVDHETAATDKLAAASVFEDVIPTLSERAKRVVRAKLDHPDLNINQLAANLDMSRDTVRRAYKDMKANESLRGLVQPEAETPPTATTPNAEEHP